MSSMFSILGCVSVASRTVLWVWPILWWVTPKTVYFCLTHAHFCLTCTHLCLTHTHFCLTCTYLCLTHTHFCLTYTHFCLTHAHFGQTHTFWSDMQESPTRYGDVTQNGKHWWHLLSSWKESHKQESSDSCDVKLRKHI